MPMVRYWAAARSAAGCEQETLAAATVGELLESISRAHDMERVLKACSLLIDGVAAPTDQPQRAVAEGAEVDVLPPFAGG